MSSIISSLIESTKKNLQLVPNFFMFLLLFATFFTKEFNNFLNVVASFSKDLLSDKNYQLIERFFTSTNNTFMFFEFFTLLFFFYLISEILIQVAKRRSFIEGSETFLFPTGIFFTILLIQQKVLLNEPHITQLFEIHIDKNSLLTFIFIVALIVFILHYIFVFASPFVTIAYIIYYANIRLRWKIIFGLIYIIILLYIAIQLLGR